MAIKQTSRKCRRCKQRTLHSKETLSGAMGCGLTILAEWLAVLLLVLLVLLV